MRLLSQMVAIALAAFPPYSAIGTAAFAQGASLGEEGFRAYLPQLRAQAQAAGVRQSTLDAIFSTLEFSPRTVSLDRAQPGGTAGNPAIPPFQPYLRQHVSPTLIARGQQRYAENIGVLNQIGRRYGVEPSVLVAIWGKETSYGGGMGDFDLLNSLASLAYEGRRRQLFSEEFIATLKLYERGFPRSQLKGSWAGAIGHPQFLPTVYLRLAVDGDGDGRADIWRSHVDALASIANYLNNAGWKPSVSWGYRVGVPAALDTSGLGTRLTSPRCPRVHERHTRWMTLGEWRQLGVVPLGSRSPPDTELMSLLEPDGRGGGAYLLTTNYRTILDYNCSNFYALSVGILADSISR
jgi:lytic murein transglycosylase